MGNRLVIIGIAVLLICIVLSGCNENSNKNDNIGKFIGEWEGTSLFLNNISNVKFTFYDDNTAKQISNETHPHWFDYEIDEKCLYLLFQEFPEIDAICYNYEFSNNNNTLILTNVSLDTLTLTKK
jgi:hypothetical protein